MMCVGNNVMGLSEIYLRGFSQSLSCSPAISEKPVVFSLQPTSDHHMSFW